MEIQGHRGTRGLRPENTLSSFRAAIEAGADRLELDLLLTKDEELVIYHDFYINPDLCVYLDGRGIPSPSLLIHSLPLSEIKRIDCGSRKNPKFPKQVSIPGETIPTLEELFAMISSSSHPNAKKIGLNLEIKGDPRDFSLTADPSVVIKKLLDVVEKSEFKQRVYYSSFDERMLQEVRRLRPDAPLAFIKMNDLEGIVEVATDLRAEIVSPDQRLLKTREDIKTFQEKGFKVMTWTVNDFNRCLELIEMGIDGIITDYPEEIIKRLEEKNLR